MERNTNTNINANETFQVIQSYRNQIRIESKLIANQRIDRIESQRITIKNLNINSLQGVKALIVNDSNNQMMGKKII